MAPDTSTVINSPSSPVIIRHSIWLPTLQQLYSQSRRLQWLKDCSSRQTTASWIGYLECEEDSGTPLENINLSASMQP
ncbi:hypothetical protein O3M35_001631 [Rhynocoris fuscipes]|uniref:Uncharacterized protein n=1 Tax=Rhynocoris fuscipes TaxID=488301 RepID=A0AAW1CPL0_9HEMI